MKKEFCYKNFTDLASQILNKGQIPTKFSKKEFTTYQLLTLLLIKIYEKKGYRAFISWLKISDIQKWLQLRKIPHFTTLQKFADRLKVPMLEKLLMTSGETKSFQRGALDATGLTFRNPSRHYEKRMTDFGQKIIKKRDFFKCAIVADVDHQLILALKTRKKSRNDNRDFFPLWNKVKHLKFKWFYMDRGYDSEENHKAIFDSGKKSFGCLKRLDVPIHRTQGTTRKMMKRQLKHKKKNWRVLIESINKAFKAVVGHVIEAKKYHTQKVDLLLKLIVYNLYRKVTRKINFYVAWIRQLIQLSILCFCIKSFELKNSKNI